MQKRKKRINNQAINKAAFDEIIGDPYAYLEPIDGHYVALRTRNSPITIVNPEQQSRSPVNPARPNPVDFCCDVERAVLDGLKTYFEEDVTFSVRELQQLFDNTYILGTGPIFNQQRRTRLEQIIGNILVKRGISPVAKYFTVVKQ